MAPCAGVKSASPDLAPLAPLHRATPPAFASAPRHLRPQPRLRHRVPVRASLPHHASAPPPCSGVLGVRFGNVFRVGGGRWLALPPPRALVASSVVLVAPGASSASAFVPHCAAPCSLVAPAGTLDAAPFGGGGNYRFGFRQNKLGQLVGRGRRAKRVSSTAQPCSFARQQGQFGEATLLNHRGGPWVSGESAGQARFGRDPSARSGVEFRTRVPRTTPAIPRPWRWRVGIGQRPHRPFIAPPTQLKSGS